MKTSKVKIHTHKKRRNNDTHFQTLLYLEYYFLVIVVVSARLGIPHSIFKSEKERERKRMRLPSFVDVV